MPRKQRLSNEQLLEINRLADDGMSQKAIAATLGISKQAVSRELSRDWTDRLCAEIDALAAVPAPLLGHEREALLRLLKAHAEGPGFQQRWRETDVQSVMFALRRITGVDLVG